MEVVDAVKLDEWMFGCGIRLLAIPVAAGSDGKGRRGGGGRGGIGKGREGSDGKGREGSDGKGREESDGKVSAQCFCPSVCTVEGKTHVGRMSLWLLLR